MKKAILLFIYTLWVCASATAQVPQLTDDAVIGSGLNQHNYVGSGWVHGSTTTVFYNNTLSFSSVAGAYVTFTFEGSGIEWYTEKKHWHGIVAISMDGGAETLIDLYSPTEQHVLVYSSPVLIQGTHTFKIRATGTKNTASTGYYAIHDYFKTYQETARVVTSPTNTFTGEGAGAAATGGSNTAIGANALTTGTGYYNTVVGLNSLKYAGAAIGNSAIGSWALQTFGDHKLSPAIVHGDYNTGIGAFTGPLVEHLTNTTSLGSFTRVTASNQIRIGNASVTSIGGQVSWSTLSDGRFKKDVKEDVSGLEFIKRLRPVSYMVDKTAVQKFLGMSDSLIQTQLSAKEKPIRQTGFVAQDVETLMKKSGYVFNGVDAPKNEKDPYTIRYAEFVVPLVKAVQELSDKTEEQLKVIADQQNQIAELLNRVEKVENGNSGLKSSEIALLQNTPNPFSVNTEIKMVLPETAISANIIIYNLEGKQLKELQVTGRGNVSATILGNELSAGMYIYALIVDGKVIDTKRMILTK